MSCINDEWYKRWVISHQSWNKKSIRNMNKSKRSMKNINEEWYIYWVIFDESECVSRFVFHQNVYHESYQCVSRVVYIIRICHMNVRQGMCVKNHQNVYQDSYISSNCVPKVMCMCIKSRDHHQNVYHEWYESRVIWIMSCACVSIIRMCITSDMNQESYE